jgi:hypothetical protein
MSKCRRCQLIAVMPIWARNICAELFPNSVRAGRFLAEVSGKCYSANPRTST